VFILAEPDEGGLSRLEHLEEKADNKPVRDPKSKTAKHHAGYATDRVQRLTGNARTR
jgi:hypothetical protein